MQTCSTKLHISIHPIPIPEATKAAPRHASPSTGHKVGWAFFPATGVQDVVFVDNLWVDNSVAIASLGWYTYIVQNASGFGQSG